MWQFCTWPQEMGHRSDCEITQNDVTILNKMFWFKLAETKSDNGIDAAFAAELSNLSRVHDDSLY